MMKHAIAVSRPSSDALRLLGTQIHEARIVRRWTMMETADRLGVDHRTLRAVEKGSPTVAIGTVFNAAFLLGVNLFGLDPDGLAAARRRGEDTLALLPRRVRSASVGGDDGIDF